MIVISDVRWPLLAAGLLLGAEGCHEASTARDAHTESAAVAPRQLTDSDVTKTVMNDAVVTRDVTGALSHDRYVDTGTMLVKTDDGVVMLTGAVGDLLSKKRAVSVAKTVKGVRAVSDQLVLRAPSFPDDEIARRVQETLLLNPVTDSYALGVDVHGGTVRLTGVTRSDADRALAIRLAESTPGVRAVTDDVRAKYVIYRPNDVVLANQVRSRLRWDVQLNGNIDASVTDGDVVLRGYANSPAEKTRAVTDAWIQAVRSVDDSGVAVTQKEDPLRGNEFVPRSDGEVADAIWDAMARDPRVESADVRVLVRGGAATLSGSVGSSAARKAAESLAHDTVGVSRVTDDLAVEPRAPLGDGAVASAVTSAIRRDAYTGPQRIEVTSHEGTITLSGVVDSEFARIEATNVAGLVRGVKSVENRLEPVRPFVANASPYQYAPAPYGAVWVRAPANSTGTDRKIATNVKRAISRTPYLDADDIQVTVSDKRATLTGTVNTPAEGRAAAREALARGAASVDNRLAVAPNGP